MTTCAGATVENFLEPSGASTTMVRPTAYGSEPSHALPTTIGAGPSTSAAANAIRFARAMPRFVQSDHSRVLPPMYVSQSERPPDTATEAMPLPVLVETKQWLATRLSPRVATSQRRTSWQRLRYSSA